MKIVYSVYKVHSYINEQSYCGTFDSKADAEGRIHYLIDQMKSPKREESIFTIREDYIAG